MCAVCSEEGCFANASGDSERKIDQTHSHRWSRGERKVTLNQRREQEGITSQTVSSGSNFPSPPIHGVAHHRAVFATTCVMFGVCEWAALEKLSLSPAPAALAVTANCLVIFFSLSLSLSLSLSIA